MIHPFQCFCGQASQFRLIRVREMMFGSKDEFNYAECIECGSLSLIDIPIDMSKYYPSEYYANKKTEKDKSLAKQCKRLVIRIYLYFFLISPLIIRALLPHPRSPDLVAFSKLKVGKKMRILDIGCGDNPRLLLILSAAGYNCLTGIDPFISATRTIGKSITLKKITIQDEIEQYDLIMAHHSLEHVHDLPSTIRAIKRLLTKNGVAIVRLPTPSSRAFSDYRENWVQLDAPRHITLPSRKAMEFLFVSAGLTIVDQYDDSTEFQFVGSNLYKAGITLTDGLNAIETGHTGSVKYRRAAMRLNRQRQGDQVTYIVRGA